MEPVAVQAMMALIQDGLRHAGPACWPALAADSAGAAGALCSAVWEGALLAGCVALGLRLMPRLSAAARSAVWLNVFGLMAALHVVPMLMRHGAGSGLAGSSPSLVPGTAIHRAFFHLDPRWSVALAALWAALTVWKLTELAASAVSLRRMARRATVVDAGEALRKLLDGTGEDGRRGRAAELCTSTEVERPCVIGCAGTGFLKPRVLIPEALLGELSEVELGQVLLHEMEHVRRWDDWRNLAQKIGVALFPLNPALAWVERRLCTERELACDDRVMRASAERKTYALCLARVAEFSLVSRGLALGAWGRRPELVKRVQRILRRPAETHTGRMAVMGPAAITLAALGCALALARSPQVVSFAPMPHETAVLANMQEQPAAASQLGAPKMIEASAWMGSTGLMGSRRQAAPAEKMPKAVMLKAVMPERQTVARGDAMPARTALVETRAAETGTQGTGTRGAGAQLARAQMTRAEMRRLQEQREWVVMTEWERIEMPQMVITVQPVGRSSQAAPSTPSYAAVPFGNGWIIVQI